MDESFSTHYQIHHLSSVVGSSYLKGGVSQKYRGYLTSTPSLIKP